MHAWPVSYHYQFAGYQGWRSGGTEWNYGCTHPMFSHCVKRWRYNFSMYWTACSLRASNVVHDSYISWCSANLGLSHLPTCTLQSVLTGPSLEASKSEPNSMAHVAVETAAPRACVAVTQASVAIPQTIDPLTLWTATRSAPQTAKAAMVCAGSYLHHKHRRYHQHCRLHLRHLTLHLTSPPQLPLPPSPSPQPPPLSYTRYPSYESLRNMI